MKITPEDLYVKIGFQAVMIDALESRLKQVEGQLEDARHDLMKQLRKEDE